MKRSRTCASVDPTSSSSLEGRSWSTTLSTGATATTLRGPADVRTRSLGSKALAEDLLL